MTLWFFLTIFIERLAIGGALGKNDCRNDGGSAGIKENVGLLVAGIKSWDYIPVEMDNIHWIYGKVTLFVGLNVVNLNRWSEPCVWGIEVLDKLVGDKPENHYSSVNGQFCLDLLISFFFFQNSAWVYFLTSFVSEHRTRWRRRRSFGREEKKQRRTSAGRRGDAWRIGK